MKNSPSFRDLAIYNLLLKCGIPRDSSSGRQKDSHATNPEANRKYPEAIRNELGRGPTSGSTPQPQKGKSCKTLRLADRGGTDRLCQKAVRDKRYAAEGDSYIRSTKANRKHPHGPAPRGVGGAGYNLIQNHSTADEIHTESPPIYKKPPIRRYRSWIGWLLEKEPSVA